MSWVHNCGVWQAEQLSVYRFVQLPIPPKDSQHSMLADTISGPNVRFYAVMYTQDHNFTFVPCFCAW